MSKEYKTETLDLRQMDCMDLMGEYPDNHFDLAVVDPPYGIDVTKMEMGGRKRNKKDKEKQWDLAAPDGEYFKELMRVSQNQIIWGGNYFELPCSQYFAVWDKGETMYGRDFAECEQAWVAKGGTRIFKGGPNQLDRIHPTQKPIKLYSWIFAKYAKPGMTIIDTHMGSGSIAIAAHYAGMHLTACELDVDYFREACERIERETRQTTFL